MLLLKNPRDVHIENFVVDGRVNNVTERTGNRWLSDLNVGDPLEKLYQRVAHNAILNAAGRADEVRCYPGTRQEVIRKIENWKNRKAQLTSRIMWLSGPAGAGKTAIVQTVVEEWKKRGVAVASFFFFRGDNTRTNSEPVVATLLYQLFDLLPALKKSAADLLSDKPLMMQDSINNQFFHFIDTPIRTLMRQPSLDIRTPIVLVIDGLDECGSEHAGAQEQVLRALHNLVALKDSPFIVLVASRPEPNLIMAFNKLSFSPGSIFLNAEYRPQNDIRRFVVDKFQEIKRAHHLSHNLRRGNWPLDADIDNIVTKSSGQFIYAATVMRFLENSPESPHITLKIVQGIEPAETYSPFAQLDAMYSYVFSQAKNSAAVKKIFAFYFISTNHSKDIFGDILAAVCDIATVESLMSPLASIVRLHRNSKSAKLVFYHASLGDFLQDELRSGIHFVDVHAARVGLHVDLSPYSDLVKKWGQTFS
ncbi:hypothetical protein D9619_011453 [Psilocybe cf. subviscida]|uniref:NACHT domain-containing protein n=1 Tax=Psilocybe cf. subviscida TaxID=2480587 RepID=A0A8H5BTP1_9AGAR|nr:hypothetical protein D9619_011453 [Psilocybe cf. subviscida]